MIQLKLHNFDDFQHSYPQCLHKHRSADQCKQRLQCKQRPADQESSIDIYYQFI